MKRGVALTLIAAGVWALGSVWYYDCKVKRVCGPQQPVAAVAATPTAAPRDAATAASVTPAPAADSAVGAPTPAVAAAAATAAAAAAPATGALPELDNREGPILVLRMNFVARSAEPQPPEDVAARLDLLRRGIAQGRKVLVLGHSDGLGARSRIAVVSQQRAEALRDWLIAQGIRASDIARVESREDREPIASNSRPEGRSLNRRAEALLTPLPQE